jgi:hypothetical protein
MAETPRARGSGPIDVRASVLDDAGGPRSIAAVSEDPPVVARVVIEIRSDGSRTIARGAMEDVASGERVAIEAQGTTPLALAAALAKHIVSAPALARHAVRGFIAGRLRGR